jgi:aminoglycoside phosphotransferase (APT) family kinase protein
MICRPHGQNVRARDHESRAAAGNRKGAAATISAEPTEQDAAVIAAEALGGAVEAAARFPTGSSHYVYDVRFAGGRRAVVRISRREQIEDARGSVYWSRMLRPKGVPLPELLHVDLTMTRHPFPLVVLERLAGDDLGTVYDRLSRRELRILAERLAAVQDIVTALPAGRAFGYAPRDDGPFPHASWRDVVAASFARSRGRIRAAGLVDEGVVDAVEATAERFAGYLDRVPPTPFLHDITTKNVIVHAGLLSGIVDVDDLCFGDPLLLIALIRMALLAHGHDPVYVEEWLDIVRPDAQQRAVLDLYTLAHCIDFMGELGQLFNRAEAVSADPAYLARLHALHARLLDQIAR